MTRFLSSCLSVMVSLPLPIFTRSFLHCALYAVIGLSVLSIAITVARERAKNRLLSGEKEFAFGTQPLSPAERFQMNWRQTLLVITSEKATRRTKIVLALIVALITGMFIGYPWGFSVRDDHLRQYSTTYHDVTVLEQWDEKTFQVRPDGMDSYKWEFCDPPPIRKREVLKSIRFEQMQGAHWCKRYEYSQENTQTGETNGTQLSMR